MYWNSTSRTVFERNARKHSAEPSGRRLRCAMRLEKHSAESNGRRLRCAIALKACGYRAPQPIAGEICGLVPPPFPVLRYSDAVWPSPPHPFWK